MGLVRPQPRNCGRGSPPPLRWVEARVVPRFGQGALLAVLRWHSVHRQLANELEKAAAHGYPASWVRGGASLVLNGRASHCPPPIFQHLHTSIRPGAGPATL